MLKMIDYTPKKKQDEYKPFSKVRLSRPILEINLIQSGYTPRPTIVIHSRVTPGHSTALKVTQKYSGSEMIGITVLHKSCLQPIFNKEAAKEVANMRR